MQNNLFIVGFAGLLALSGQSYGQTPKKVVDFLAVPGPIVVQQQAHQLVWSSHADASLYKHEYLPAGDAFPNYKSLVTIDFLVTESSLDQAVAIKTRQLEQLKRAKADVQYEIIANPATGEKIIDCLIGQTAANEQNSVLERDVYRYQAIKAKTGQRGIVLFALSTRKYGKDMQPFLVKLQTDRPTLISEVAKLRMPEIRVVQ
jgi:hypothetical protein